TLRLDFARSLAVGDKRPDAEVQYKKVIEAQPANAQAWFGLGQLYAAWVPARTDDAIAAYEKAIQADPTSFVAERAGEELSSLGVASPVSASPVAASPVATQ